MSESEDKPMQFSWKWIFPVLAFAGGLSSNSAVAGIVIGAVLTAGFYIATSDINPIAKTDTKWIIFTILLFLAFVAGGVRRSYNEDRAAGRTHEFEYDRDRP